jgi:hypothetical protein
MGSFESEAFQIPIARGGVSGDSVRAVCRIHAEIRVSRVGVAKAGEHVDKSIVIANQELSRVDAITWDFQDAFYESAGASLSDCFPPDFAQLPQNFFIHTALWPTSRQGGLIVSKSRHTPE